MSILFYIAYFIFVLSSRKSICKMCSRQNKRNELKVCTPIRNIFSLSQSTVSFYHTLYGYRNYDCILYVHFQNQFPESRFYYVTLGNNCSTHFRCSSSPNVLIACNSDPTQIIRKNFCSYTINLNQNSHNSNTIDVVINTHHLSACIQNIARLK